MKQNYLFGKDLDDNNAGISTCSVIDYPLIFPNIPANQYIPLEDVS